MRLIDGDALIAWIKESQHMTSKMRNIICKVETMPSADKPQGKWKAKSHYEYFCNNCGFSFDIMKCDFLENMKYCPNCGVPKGADDD